MDAKQILFDKMFQCFITQNPEEGFFDVIFEIEGKKLYADKFRLAAISTTFRSMLSERWNSKNEPIKIEGNTYEHFKEFLTFIYSGECNLTDENIFAMIDIAECYNVEVLKNICDKYSSKMEITNENAFQFLELANKYSLIQLKKTAANYFQTNFSTLTNSDKFLSLDGTLIKEMIVFAENKTKPEEIFVALCKWCEYQAELKKAESDDLNFILNDAIKNEMKDFLSHIQFCKMELDFIVKFVVLKAFIFPSLQELSDILSYFTSKNVTVNVIGPNGEILQGKLPREDSAVEVIKTLKNSPSIIDSGYNDYFYWITDCKVPAATTNQLKIREHVEWYLIYFRDGYFGIRHRSQVNNNYLIAEMFSEKTIVPSAGWKIEIL